MLKHSIRLLIHYLKFSDVPIPYSSNHLDTLIWTLFDLNCQGRSSDHTSIQQRRFLLLKLLDKLANLGKIS